MNIHINVLLQMARSVIIVCNRDLAAAAVCKTGLVDHCSNLLREPTATQQLRCPLAPPSPPACLTTTTTYTLFVCLRAIVYRTNNTNRQTVTCCSNVESKIEARLQHLFATRIKRIADF